MLEFGNLDNTATLSRFVVVEKAGVKYSLLFVFSTVAKIWWLLFPFTEPRRNDGTEMTTSNEHEYKMPWALCGFAKKKQNQFK